MSAEIIDIEVPAAPALKYLWAAHLADGRELFQNQQDLSLIAPGRNCFYDLLEHDSNGDPICHPKDGLVLPRLDIEIFQLHDPQWEATGEGNRWTVDLRSGAFEANGARFLLGEPPAGGGLLLVYFRRVRQHLQSTVLDGRILRSRALDAEVEYHIGWTTTDKEITRTIIIN
jgi:hypothetical protein